MALEISEIGIRMQVRDGEAGAAGSGGAREACASEGERAAGERDDLVAECVRRVLRALKTLQER